MKTAAILIDEWKLEIFDKHLKAAGYSYQKYPGLTAGILNLRVQYEWVSKLQPVIEAATKEAAAAKKGK